jgi:hypothetical protein
MLKETISAGETFGFLTTLERIPAAKTKDGKARWICKCRCGKTREVDSYAMRKGLVTSCGCYYASLIGNRSRIHGMARTRIYAVWKTMHSRCENPNAMGYKNWGGRGITVCERWKDFRNFLADMGPPPPKLTLERKNNGGNYEPDNCYWATRAAQAINQRRTIFITHNGMKLALSQWAAVLGISHKLIWKRYNKGWSPQEIFSKTLWKGRINECEVRSCSG